MRIYEIKEIPVTDQGNWDRVFHISFNEVSIPGYGEFDDWLRRVVASKRNPNGIIGPLDYYYVLLSHYQGWVSCNGHSGSFNNGPKLTHYELRCHNPLAELFLKVYSIPQEEYDRNIKYIRDRENRGRGYFDTRNGEVFSYGDVEVLVTKHRSEIRTIEESQADYEKAKKVRRRNLRKTKKKPSGQKRRSRV